MLSAAWFRSAARADRVHGEPTRPGGGAASGAARESPITAWVRISRDGSVTLIASQDVNFLSKRVGNYQWSPANGMLIDQLWVR